MRYSFLFSAASGLAALISVVSAAGSCTDFNLDCVGCTEAPGCFYCPADGLCLDDQSELFSQSRCERFDFLSKSTCNPVDLYQSQSVSDGSSNENPFYSDPLYGANAWAFKMINLLPAWEKGYTGAGIIVRMNDSGMDVDHPEFSGRINLDLSCANYKPLEPNLSHGTNTASLVGASGNNECSVGVAPQVIFSACNYRNNPLSQVFGDKAARADIIQNSFGAANCRRAKENKDNRFRNLEGKTCPFLDNAGYNESSATEFPCDVCDFSSNHLTRQCEESIYAHCVDFRKGLDHRACSEFVELYSKGGHVCFILSGSDSQKIIQDTITKGRGGKGSIYVFSAGNHNWSGGDLNFDGIDSSRFTISVGSVAQDMRRSVFSVGGAGLTVVSPGGSYLYANDFVVASTNGTCSTIGKGTSFSTPIVSGVIALMLEANPALTWRDVQAIIIKTARIPNVIDNDGQIMTSSLTSETPEFTTTDATTNAANFTHSYGYGFGIIDAGAAVAAAEEWKLLEDERRIDVWLTKSFIPDDSTKQALLVLSVSQEESGDRFVVESVSVTLHLRHSSIGDLRIVLTSPQGTESVLSPGNRNVRNVDGDALRLSTLRCWGESSLGDWTLSIEDLNVSSAGSSGQLSLVQLNVYGRDGDEINVPPTGAPTGSISETLPPVQMSHETAPPESNADVFGSSSPNTDAYSFFFVTMASVLALTAA